VVTDVNKTEAEAIINGWRAAAGADLTGLVEVADAMLDQGVV